MTGKRISFTAEMARAIFDGRKTQTRRIIKPQPKNILSTNHREKWPKPKYNYGDEVQVVDQSGCMLGNVRITDSRLERVQDITNEDAVAEGVGPEGGAFPTHAFHFIWDSIYGKGAWDRNDWVWAYTFKVVEVKR